MRRLAIGLLLLLAFSVATSSIDALRPAFWRPGIALAQGSDVRVQEAFEAARQLGTVEAWNAFLQSYPTGFYADLARAYLKSLGGKEAETERPKVEAPTAGADLAPTDPRRPAVKRGGQYMGFAERFNRYYTDPSWKPSRILYVSPNGNGSGASRDAPMSPAAAFAAARPGALLFFMRGAYNVCLEFGKEQSGTYDQPIVLFGERNPDKSLGVAMTCCSSGRQTCLNFEGASYIAVDGFELIGGHYGVRAIGEGYPASQHSRGIAVIDCHGHDQERDPFFSGQADWAVWERNVAHGARRGDGHGFYLSNGGDWNIVRFNETFNNVASDFQINPGPAETCKEVDIPLDDPRCDGYAGTGEGGLGASDYFLVDSNYFHHGGSGSSGANFTSVRRSVVRNNVFGFYPRHGVSFWQETDNPKLGSSENKILHNLFITTGRHAVQFINKSTRNEFANNLILGIRISGDTVAANPSALLMHVDDTVGDNIYRHNLYVGGKIEGRVPNAEETVVTDFSPAWFMKFPVALNRNPNDYRPTALSPLLGKGRVSPYAPTDRYGTARSEQVDLGPIGVR